MNTLMLEKNYTTRTEGPNDRSLFLSKYTGRNHEMFGFASALTCLNFQEIILKFGDFNGRNKAVEPSINLGKDVNFQLFHISIFIFV